MQAFLTAYALAIGLPVALWIAGRLWITRRRTPA